MTYKCEYFNIKELVPPNVYEDRGEKAWQLFDDRVLRLADFLRERFGTAIINNWASGGNYSESGLRVPSCRYYSTYSQHSFGRGLDIKFTGHKAEDVRQWLKENWESKGLGFPITLEENVSWLHVDVRQSDKLIQSFWP